MSLPLPASTPYRLGFVCLGNICRSPTAAVVLDELLDSAGLATEVEVTSCGTGSWHVGEPMDPRAAAQLLAQGYDASAHRARHFDETFHDLDLLLAMDAQNLAEVTAGRGPSERVRMFRSFDPLLGRDADPSELDVPDPWFGAEDGFVEVLAIMERTCRRILSELRALSL